MFGKGWTVCLAWLTLAMFESPAALAGTLTVVSTSPTRHALTAPIAPKIAVAFDRAVNPASITAQRFVVSGRWTGPVSGNFSYSGDGKTVTFTPNKPFAAGDVVTVMLAETISAVDTSPMPNGGYTFQFWTRTRAATMDYTLFDSFSNRTTPEVTTRIYGAAAVDLNNDGFCDLTTINEDSADVRVFLNLADGQGNYGPFLTPFPITVEASPNEPSDFNHDGKPDIAIAAVSSSSVWVLLGNGDGTWQPPGQEISVGSAPHGIALLDADGDADVDIVTSNTGGNNVSLLLNNGSGVFGPATNFDSTRNGEYAIGSGDMNGDGILDIVVGARSDQDIVVMRGTGGGSYVVDSIQDAGGSVWMIALGDVNGDGLLDVSTANSSSANGSILLGNGDGTLQLPVTYAAASHTVATDLGDLDGDGDLDWTLSDFGGSEWEVYRNNGSGSFTFAFDVSASANPSCAVILDFDNDRDLDLVLTDEIADILTLHKNNGTLPLADFDNDGDVDAANFTTFEGCFTGPGGSYPPSCELGDFDGDADIDCDDYASFGDVWTGPGPVPSLSACAAAIPATSAWGLLALAGLTLCVGTIRAGGVRRGTTEGIPA